MDLTLPKLYKEYGQYSNWRNFPLDLDGLKPVERRVLVSANKIAKTKFVKSRQVDAYTIGHYHPHGECIVGDTKILLLNGKKVKVKNLVGKKSFWVYSCTKEGIIKPGLAHSARMVKKVSKIYRVYLDNKTYFDCTEDHPVMLRNGDFVKAKSLKSDDSLMPLNLRTEDGYTFYKDNSRTICQEEKVSWMVIRELINKDLDSLIGFQKYHTHHKNNIRNDDNPNNLELLYYKDHCSETAKNRSDESNKIIGKKVKDAYILNKNNFKEKALKGLKKGRKRMFSDSSPLREKIRQKNSDLMTSYNKRYVEDRILKILNKMLSNNIEINQNNYEQYRTEIYNGPLWKTIFKKFNSLQDAIDIARNYNHTVYKIEIINMEKEVEVYDISVEKYHNFAIDGGIFVHNCYGTIVQLVRQGFLIGQGNFGSNVGIEPTGPAAPRYTECKMAQRTIDLAFKYISYVPEIPTEMGDIEPAYLPTMMPICLIGNEYTQGIGFGYKTYIPCYTYKSLKDRLMWLLGHRKTEPIPVPISDCLVTASPDDLKELLTTGKSKINVEGIIEENPKQNTVTLKSWAPGKRFESILSKFSKELEAGLIGFTDLSAVETDIVFQVLRERNRDKIYQEFVEKLKEVIKGSISFEIIVVDSNNKVITKSVDNLLLDTYKMFHAVNEKMIKEEISRLTDVIEEYNLLDIIRPTLAKCIGLGMDIESTMAEIARAKMMTDVSGVRNLIDKYKIKKLLTYILDTNELVAQRDGLSNTLKDLDKFLIDQYSNFK